MSLPSEVTRHAQAEFVDPVGVGKWNVEASLRLGGLIVGGLLVLVGGCDSGSRRRVGEGVAPTIIKQPVVFAQRTFDPVAPPAEMPPLGAGEAAECDSNFLSSASVRGETRRTGGTHAILTVTGVKVTLQLRINIWLPVGASERLMEHEEGHRQISEHYYEMADKVAERVAASYIGKRVEISGADLGAEASNALQELAGEITAEYNKELNPGPAQDLYDTITDHGRNDVVVKDALDHALKNVAMESAGAKAGQ